MKFHEQYEFPADVETVFEIFGDPEFIAAKYASLGSGAADVETLEADGEGRTLVVRRSVQVKVPSFAKKFLKPDQTVIQTELWDGPDGDGVRTGTWKAEAVGVPSTTGGTLRLEPTASGCVQHVEGEVKVNVPLVGGKIADFAGGEALDEIRKEAAFTKKWVADQA